MASHIGIKVVIFKYCIVLCLHLIYNDYHYTHVESIACPNPAQSVRGATSWSMGFSISLNFFRSLVITCSEYKGVVKLLNKRRWGENREGATLLLLLCVVSASRSLCMDFISLLSEPSQFHTSFHSYIQIVKLEQCSETEDWRKRVKIPLRSQSYPSLFWEEFYSNHKLEDNLDLTLMWSVSGRLTTESFLGSPEPPSPCPIPPTARPPPGPNAWKEEGREARGKAPTDIWCGSITLCGMALRTAVWPDGVWGGPMDVEETLVDWGGLGAAGCAPSRGKDGCDADSALASWLRLPICKEWVLLWVPGRWTGLAMCCWTRESWEPEVGPVNPLDPYWKDRPPVASGLWTGGLGITEAKAPEAISWDWIGEAITGLCITWNLLTILGLCMEFPWLGGQKFIATACCREAMAEFCWVEEGGGRKIPPGRGEVRVIDMARGRGVSTCCTISRSYLTISWIISFSRLLKTPELRSCWTLCIRIEFFFPAMTEMITWLSVVASQTGTGKDSQQNTLWIFAGQALCHVYFKCVSITIQLQVSSVRLQSLNYWQSFTFFINVKYTIYIEQ